MNVRHLYYKFGTQITEWNGIDKRTFNAKMPNVRKNANRSGVNKRSFNNETQISMPNLCSDERSVLGSARTFGPKALSVQH